MIMAILGGNDAGGGVIWAPQVIEDARAHGLVLGANGKLYDTKRGEKLPPEIKPMPLLDEAELKAFPELPVSAMVRGNVARYWDLMALAATQPVKVIAENGVLRDKPGFEVEFLTRGTIPETTYKTPRHEILMPMRGHWRLTWESGETTLNPGDTCAVPPGMPHALAPSMTGEVSLFRIRNTDDPAGPTWKPH
jgi:mannose-6-phosphate isomerase-like protein (cupin superfamily)